MSIMILAIISTTQENK
ncbi:hypothetical protein ACE3Y5_001128 [Salmonella enterica]